MNRSLIIFLILFLFCDPSYAQWAKSFGEATPEEAGLFIQQTSDGGYVLTGRIYSLGAGKYDHNALALKLSSKGDVVWKRTYGGGSYDDGQSIQQTSDGGYILTGRTESFGAGKQDVLVLKLDKKGYIVWQKTFGGGADDEGHSIQQTSDGGYILTGETQSFGAGSVDLLVLRLDSSGDILWQKTFGSTFLDAGWSIQQTSDGGYILTGFSGGIGLYDILVLRLDSSGNIVWQKVFGGTKSDAGWSIQQTSDGGYVLAGYTQFFGNAQSYGTESYDILVLRLDSSGSIVWQKTFGGDKFDVAWSIQKTSDEGYILTGYTESFGAGGLDALILKLDSSGNVVWQKTFGGTKADESRSIQQTSDGGYILTGVTGSFGAKNSDVLVLKLDKDGNIPGCTYLNDVKVTVNTPSVTVKDTILTVTNLNQPMANINATVSTPSIKTNTICQVPKR